MIMAIFDDDNDDADHAATEKIRYNFINSNNMCWYYHHRIEDQLC